MVKLSSGPQYVCDVEELDPRDVQRLELLEKIGGLTDNPNKPNQKEGSKVNKVARAPNKTK